MKTDRLDHGIATQMPDADAAKGDGELTSSMPLRTLTNNPWPTIRQAVHAYAKCPSDENALAVEASMLLLKRQRDAG